MYSQITTRSARRDTSKFGNILPNGVNLLDFIRQICWILYETTHQIQCQTYSMKSLVQSLKFVAHQAEVYFNDKTASKTAKYIPYHSMWLYPLKASCCMTEDHSLSSRLILGCYLFMFWAGLRFQDLQRTRPTSISLTEGVLRAVCEPSKAGQPQPAACLACGFTSHSFGSGWGFT